MKEKQKKVLQWATDKKKKAPAVAAAAAAAASPGFFRKSKKKLVAKNMCPNVISCIVNAMFFVSRDHIPGDH